IGTTASTARISDTVSTWDPKVHTCVRKRKRRPARHHQRGRPSARMLLKWLSQNLCPWNPHKRYPSKPHLLNQTERRQITPGPRPISPKPRERYAGVTRNQSDKTQQPSGES